MEFWGMLFSSPGNDLTWIMTYDLFAVVQHISGCGQPFWANPRWTRWWWTRSTQAEFSPSILSLSPLTLCTYINIIYRICDTYCICMHMTTHVYITYLYTLHLYYIHIYIYIYLYTYMLYIYLYIIYTCVCDPHINVYKRRFLFAHASLCASTCALPVVQ